MIYLAWIIVILAGARYWLSQEEVSLRLLSPVDLENTDNKRSSAGSKRYADSYEKTDFEEMNHVLPDQKERSAGQTQKKYGPPEHFDPNMAPFEIMVAAGLPERIVHTMINYREKGGKFYKPEDLLKIYIMTDSIYREVEPWIRIPPVPKAAARNRPRDPIDVNQANLEEWTFLPGIGQGYAKQICRFRDALGGFASIDQVSETFGLPDTVFQRIRSFLTCSPIPTGILINKLSAEELAMHPYIRPREARILVNYRTQHGPYSSILEIRRSMAIQDTLRLNKLQPYWRFSEN